MLLLARCHSRNPCRKESLHAMDVLPLRRLWPPEATRNSNEPQSHGVQIIKFSGMPSLTALILLAAISVAISFAQSIPQGELSFVAEDFSLAIRVLFSLIYLIRDNAFIVVSKYLSRTFLTSFAGQWADCPPNTSLQGAEEFFSTSMFVREHLVLTRPPSISNDTEVTRRSIQNYDGLLATRKCM